MVDVKRVKIQVVTARSTYVGHLTIPQMRKRVSDVLNEEERLFINLTDVTMEGRPDQISFVSLNKNMVESVSIVEEER